MKSIPLWNPVNIENITGEYKISGINQDAERTAYTGILKVSLDENNKIIAHWSINSDSQTMQGTGFYKDNMLVINFNYVGDDTTTYKGVAVYRIINANVLNGFWSEKHGDQKFLGEEQCLRINTTDNKN
ncbi:hypothetical protein H2O64_04110 [Kordia sp. YSTF-M3]|uniref:Uncharacterized protein n=1 Tax=Kordia aestuariivivens TaxID=2759037 RepID=A0ABR7Q5M4_9FLAO|nr:hypothetical protein [Kordia aestuariivivens]MBC8753840.1 hypothetical protein [Kordia aestuariivivens]